MNLKEFIQVFQDTYIQILGKKCNPLLGTYKLQNSYCPCSTKKQIVQNSFTTQKHTNFREYIILLLLVSVICIQKDWYDFRKICVFVSRG